MKNFITYAWGIAIALTLGACSNSKINYVALFAESQPESSENLADFPKNFQGKYLNKSDSSILTINSKGLYLQKSFPYTLHINELDSNEQLSGDTVIINNKDHSRQITKRVKDSLLITINSIDTIFEIKEDQHLKRLGKHYILNSKIENGWLIRKLNKHKKLLTIASLEEQEVNTLKEIASSSSDSIPYYFKISEKNFKHFVNHKGFRYIDTLALIEQ